ncbi:MAG: DUF975 family protein [Roseburia sp.]|nr:DUF975 family protein [Roseburia sp.]
MIRAKECRRRAWNAFTGGSGANCGIMIVAMLIYDVLVSIASIIVSGTMTFGISKLSLDIVRGKKVKFETMFDGFYCFAKTFVLGLLIGLFTLLWGLLLIIPGIIKSYSYSMSYYISVDDPKLSAEEARKKSMELMKGNKWRYFCLQLSFIGWILLTIITFGLASIFVAPYMQIAYAEFYNDLVGGEKTSAVSGGGANGAGGGEDVFCSNCGAANPDGSAFCRKCGNKIAVRRDEARVCPQCGAACKEGAVFCGKCGCKLADAETAAGVTCPACGAVCDADAVVCTQCGRKFPISRNWNEDEQEPKRNICPNCGEENRAEAAYCKKCGERLK